MPETSEPNGQRYTIDGNVFTWTTDDGGAVTMPLRIKLKVIRKMADRDLDVAAMFDIIEAVAPGQADILDEMDVNDFEACFSAWQKEYTALSGATMGESPPSLS